MRRLLTCASPVLFLVLAVASCNDLPTADAGVDPLLEINNAPQNQGNQRLFFLAPMVADPGAKDEFDGSLSPLVRISECEETERVDPQLVEFTTGTGMGAMQVDNVAERLE